ncbi:PH domain-containing protein [Marinomonas colpomeniae]|uniref:ElaB/YqjD/DUF883 family membrane-anchored ribosome-binding protein n=1 Tax=Marinomonas colpomeniae TaxID=2774408 RepID=A0ABR8NVF9_9GAMM|nr:hypothetical protein [Marinomonas colpomeniae]MBD5769449.1 hypothetical protein [Marinomonas colpomeniae]
MATEKKPQNTTQAKVEETRAKAEEATMEAVEKIKTQVKDGIEVSSENIKTATAKAENVIKERPLLSIGCAFLAGWAVSKLIK